MHTSKELWANLIGQLQIKKYPKYLSDTFYFTFMMRSN